ncbi:hypothetical protein OF83DRAFT_1055044 [Amylostereum chailletii]|nr:hypothetical protein OF83DRAFT_1055044 [Amylostereum chailletii]
MKARDYCCCAIPTVNAGIYGVLLKQAVLGILVGTLALATPSIVGDASPSFAPWILAIICYAGAVIQVLGFIGVAKEKSVLFRRYTTLHIIVTLAAFSVAAVWIGLSAGRHDNAQSQCERDFFSTNSTTNSNAVSSEGQTLCNIFPWVDVGVMGGIWLLLAISQLYFYTVVSGYGSGQRADHKRYDSVYSVTNLNSDIPMQDRSDPWDAREDGLGGNGRYGHARNESTTSDAAMLEGAYNQPYAQPYTDDPAYPTGAHTQTSAPTPHAQYNIPSAPSSAQYNDPYYNSGYSTGADVAQPEVFRPHPGQS